MSIECSVCRGLMVLLQNDETYDTISATGCGHTFHKRCLQGWLAISMTCPKCRVAIRDSSTIKELHFDVVTTDQHDPAIIEAECDSLEMKMNEKDAEICILKMTMTGSNHECDLALSQIKLMKTKVTNMILNWKNVYSQINEVVEEEFENTSIWKEAAISRDKWIGDMVDMDATLAGYLVKLDQMTNEDNAPWEMLGSMMNLAISHLKIRLDIMEDCRVRLFGELANGEVLLKTTTDRHLAEMEQAKQLQQTSQRELDYLKAEMKTWNTPKWVSGTSHPTSSTVGSSEIAGNFQALLQSEREQHKTEPNAAEICCQNNGATAAMELESATDQLKKEIPIREVGQARTLPVKKCRPSRSNRRKKQLQRWSRDQPPAKKCKVMNVTSVSNIQVVTLPCTSVPR